MTLKKVSKLYFDSYKLRVKRNTYTKVKYIYYRCFTMYSTILDKDINEIDAEELINFQKYLKERYTNDTAVRMFYVLINVFEFAKKMQLIQYNIAREMKTLKLQRKKRQFSLLSDQDFYKMLLKIKDFQKRVFLELIYNTGLRNAEARALTWDCIDFEKKLLTVNKSISCDSYKYYEIITPKTQSSYRTIMIDKNTIKLLQQLKKENKNGDFVFNRDGFPHTKNYCKQELRKACKEAEINHVSIHDLRHLHATNMLMKDIQIAFISRRLGHANTRVTENMYIHLVPNADSCIVKEIEEKKINFQKNKDCH